MSPPKPPSRSKSSALFETFELVDPLGDVEDVDGEPDVVPDVEPGVESGVASGVESGVASGVESDVEALESGIASGTELTTEPELAPEAEPDPEPPGLFFGDGPYTLPGLVPDEEADVLSNEGSDEAAWVLASPRLH